MISSNNITRNIVIHFLLKYFYNKCLKQLFRRSNKIKHLNKRFKLETKKNISLIKNYYEFDYEPISLKFKHLKYACNILL